MRVALNVFVSMMSAPASQIGAVDCADDVGTRDRQQVVVAEERMVMPGKPIASIVGLVEPLALHHRAHRAVDHENAPFEGLQGESKPQSVLQSEMEKT